LKTERDKTEKKEREKKRERKIDSGNKREKNGER